MLSRFICYNLYTCFYSLSLFQPVSLKYLRLAEIGQFPFSYRRGNIIKEEPTRICCRLIWVRPPLITTLANTAVREFLNNLWGLGIK